MARLKMDRSFEMTVTVLDTFDGVSAKGNKWFGISTTGGTFFPEMEVVASCGLSQLEAGQRICLVGEYEGEQINYKTKAKEAKLTIDEVFVVPSIGSPGDGIHAPGVNGELSKAKPM